MLLSGLSAAACATPKSPPQIIVADGETYIACRDLVWIDNEGGGFAGGDMTFRVKFTDAAGFSHVMKGIRKLSVIETVPTTPSCK